MFFGVLWARQAQCGKGNREWSRGYHLEAFFVDYAGRIYVRTFENGEVEGSRIHDVFTSEGVFISRINLELSFDREYKYALSRNKKIYGFKEKGNGFEQFISYRITWK